jgi:precorrin-6B methylase 2
MTMSSAPDFDQITIRCSGMLAPSIYKRMYEVALRSADGLIVEVGTYGGAATVALALGLRDAGKCRRVVSFGRARDPDAYRRRVKQNLRFFGVEDLVELIVGEVGNTADAIPEHDRISVLVIDADGSIDRDMALFFNRVVPGGAIIIDDCTDLVRMRRVGWSTTIRIDAKMRLAYLLLSYFKSKGIISAGTQIKNTYFGEKLRGFPDDKLDLNDVLEVYRQLIFTTARMSPWQPIRRTSIQLLQRISPTYTARLRVLYRRNV